MMMSIFLVLEGMLLLTLTQHDKIILKQSLSSFNTRILRVWGALFLLAAMALWISRDNTSMGMAHAIMLFGLVALLPVFLLSFRPHWLPFFAVVIPFIGTGVELYHLI